MYRQYKKAVTPEKVYPPFYIKRYSLKDSFQLLEEFS